MKGNNVNDCGKMSPMFIVASLYRAIYWKGDGFDYDNPKFDYDILELLNEMIYESGYSESDLEKAYFGKIYPDE